MPSKEWRTNPDNLEKIRSSRRKWYANNKEKACTKVKERKLQIREWIKDYKDNLKCELCGENHPATLQFHHKDPTQKELEISRVSRYGWSQKKIQEELNKCQVLCANCHFKLHYDLAKG